jgi:hypothetical protein
MSLSKLVSCLHCGNVAKMEIVGSVSDLTVDDDPNYGFIAEYGTVYSVLKCPNPKCEQVTIVSYYWNDGVESEDDITYKLLYPQKSNYPNGLPNEILSAYAAAESVKSIDVNAYTLLLRRVLEMVCLDRNAKHDILANMLKELSLKGEIPEKLVNVALGLKNFGNVGAHAGIGKLTEKEIPIVTALCNAILEYVYSAPYLASLAEEKLKEIKVKKV